MAGPYKLNNFEMEAVKELEERFSEDLSPSLKEDDTLFYRFLKARDYDVHKAELALRKHIAWRRAYQVDTILETFTPKEVFSKYIGSSLLGLDKEGNVIRYNPMGKIDPRDIDNSMKMNDYMKHFIWTAEGDTRYLTQQNIKSGTKAYQAIIIFNMNGLTFAAATSKFGPEFGLRLTHLLQDNYPERMKAMYIINAPVYFTIGFSLVKKVMSNHMLRKIHVFGQNGWKEALLEEIDADVLPAFLGGKRTDPDGDTACKTSVLQGQKVPKKYFLTNEERYFKNVEDVKRVAVQPGSDFHVITEVESCGSIIRWKFEVKSKDIEFGLFYKKSDEELEEVLPLQRIVTIDGTETGSFKCQSAGTYVIIFDNTQSWYHSKDVLYSITVEK